MGLRAHNFKKLNGARSRVRGVLTFYGPDNTRATKLVAAIVYSEGEKTILRRWTIEDGDIRYNSRILEEAATFFKKRKVSEIIQVDGIFGCPHEEGIDYPGGTKCPKCPYWAVRSRFSGEIEQ